METTPLLLRHCWGVHLIALRHRGGQGEVEAHAGGRGLGRAVEGVDVGLATGPPVTREPPPGWRSSNKSPMAQIPLQKPSNTFQKP